MNLPKMKFHNIKTLAPIIQGGMGIGLSSYKLAGTVALEGGMGVLSSAALDRIVAARVGKKRPLHPREAAAIEVQDAKKIGNGGSIGMNIMVAVMHQYDDSVLGSMDGGVDAIISGAGLPLKLPEIAKTHSRFNDVALIPIVATGRGLDLICRRWSRSGRIPDAVVVEGPKAGGHIAWRKIEEAMAPENQLENLVPDVLEVAKKWGGIPVIAAGGIYTNEDIHQFIQMGCVGVQMGTRFLATHESGASETYKKKLIECKKEDIILAEKYGSPCGMLFRVIKDAPFYEEAVAQLRKPNCSKGYVLNKDLYCSSKVGTETLCICNGLLASIGLNPKEKELYTIGSNGYRIDKIISVKELMDELKDLISENSIKPHGVAVGHIY